MSNVAPRYILLNALGQGGMGTVLLAEDTQLGRKVAVKFISDKLEDDPRARERLHREARSAAALDHPYICKVHDIVVIDGRVGIVMEYVRGETLAKRLGRRTLGAADALGIAGEIAEAMEEAHRRGVIHRDLKPSNVMLTESGHVKVMDFGLAKAMSANDGGASQTDMVLTDAGLRLGTPRYMSPEQILAGAVDARSDIFAFGLLLYELIVGVHPFHHSSSSDIMAAIIRDPHPPLAYYRSGLPASAQEVVDRLLAKEPGGRYQSFRDVRVDVEQLRRDVGGMTSPGSRMPVSQSTDATSTGLGSSRAATATEDRRQLTVIFCEIEGFGDISNSLDAEDLLEIGEQYRSIWHSEIQRFGGTPGPYADGALYGYFGYPIAHEHDARRALSCGLAIRSAIDVLVKRAGQAGLTRPAVRIGINTNFAIVGQQNGVVQVHGSAASVAARLAEHIGGGSVVASHATMRVGGRGFEYKALGHQRIRGFTDPVLLYEVVAEADARARLDHVSPADMPALVGRDLELSMLRQRWTQARGGQGSVVFVSGEAGIGKSRLVDAFIRGVASDEHVWVESLSCSALGSNTPFGPLIEHVEKKIWPGGGKDEGDTFADLRSFLAGVGAESDQTLFLLAKLLNIGLPAEFPPPSLAPAAQQGKTAQLLLQLLTRPQRGNHGLILIDDLHWADPTTLGWLDLLVGQVPALPLLVLVTGRPPCHPAWLSRPRTSAITLGRLEAHDILTICQARCSAMRLPPEILQHVADKTDGVPLFAEELTNMILESGILEAEGDHYVLKGPLPMQAIPTTLHGSLIARLDGLSQAKYVAEIGAVVGRTFSFEIMQALSGEREHVLSQHLQKLVDAELLFQSGFVPEASYTFKHALIQDAAYNGMLRARRAELHERVALALEARESADHPEVVAYHYAHAGKPAKAAELYQRAGRHAMTRYGNTEAIQHLEAALEQLRQVPESSERDVAELSILTLLGPARNMIKGYLDPEAERILTRATELCRGVDTPEPLVFALVGLSTTHMIRAHYGLAADAATKIGDTARVTQNSDYHIMSHTMLACVNLFMGQLGAATRYATEVGRLHVDSAAIRRMALLGWGSVDVSCRSYGALTLSLLGYPDRAAEQSAMTIKQAGTSEYHLDIYHGHLYHGLAKLSERNWTACEQTMSEYLPLGHAYGDPFPIAICTIAHRLSLRGAGNSDAIHEAKALMEQLRQRGYGLGYSFLLGLVADGALHYGNVEAADAAVREAFDHLDKAGPEFWEAEVHRLNGDVLRARGQPEAVVAQSYMRAIDVAERQGAKLLELRAATSLVRVLAGSGDQEPARQRLQCVYDWFTEGFDAADLVDARRVLNGQTA
jgi:serine/threonine protein kinase